MSYVVVFTKNCNSIKLILVDSGYIHSHNLYFLMIDCLLILGKEGKIHVFQLTDFEGEQNEDVVRNRTECKHHKLEATKGRRRLQKIKPNTKNQIK